MRGALLLSALLSFLTPAFGGSPHVYVVVVDGLDARWVSGASTPRLLGLRESDARTTTVFGDARAVMPTRTNPSHVSLLTGTYPDAHGVTGNAYWSRRPGDGVAKLEDPALLEVDTLFSAAEEAPGALVTFGVFAKPKLGRLFAAVPGRQRDPDVLWTPSGSADDATTMAALLDACATREPDLAAVNLAGVDRAAHGFGPASAEREAAVRAADQAVGRLVGALKERGRWERSVVVVTADHGFDDVGPTPERPRPVLVLSRVLDAAGVRGLRVAGEGGLAHVYAEASAAPDALERAAAVAAATPGVAEVLARRPVPSVPLLTTLHLDWHLDHERAGDLVVVAASGWHFVDPVEGSESSLRGNHGGPGQRHVPLVVSGGWSGLRAAPSGGPPVTLADVGATVRVWLGLRPPQRTDGSPAPRDLVGTPIAALVRDRTAGSTP